ncbi:MAG: hypothetical protein OXM54_12760 [Acidimicrobiaceae bacterium]|nr:hypothetical protein [Acidimicrobiaceae bacterium]
MTTDPKTEQPTREQLEEDLSIPSDFDTVLDRIMAGHGTDDGD